MKKTIKKTNNFIRYKVSIYRNSLDIKDERDVA